MISINSMIKQLSGLLGTEDINEFEQSFIGNITDKTQDGKLAATLSERQVTVLEKIWKKHFA